MNVLPSDSAIRNIDLNVRNIETSADFYSGMLGFRIVSRDDSNVYLSATGSEPYMIGLHEDNAAPARMRGTPGLYHVAFKFTGRKELAKVFMRLFDAGMKFQGFSDHLVSEAIYLSDPDGNGIEIYVDKPEREWVWKMGEVVMDSLPLDLSVVTKEYDKTEDWTGIHPETKIGHIHLNVSDLLNAEKFYSRFIGFNVTNFSYPGARFFAAGKYHHHIGANTWSAKRDAAKVKGSLGMKSFSIYIPDEAAIKNIVKIVADNDLILEEHDGEKVIVKDFDDNEIVITSR